MRIILDKKDLKLILEAIESLRHTCVPFTEDDITIKKSEILEERIRGYLREEENEKK